MNNSSFLASGVAALLVAACSTSASSDSPTPSASSDAAAEVVSDTGTRVVTPPAIVADSGAADASPQQAFLIKCEGINTCKGTSECKSATNACKGLNDCAGHGYLLVPEAECVDKNGKVLS